MRISLGRALCVLAVFALATACSSDPGPGDDRIDDRAEMPAAPDHGFQFVLPELEFPAATEKMQCWYTTVPSDFESWMLTYQSFQGDSGHHLIAFLTFEDVPDGTVVDCTDPESMSYWMPFLTPPKVTGDNSFPEGLGQKIPANARLVFQSHYVNTNDKPIVTRDVVNITTAEDPTGLIPTAPWAVTTLDMALPAGAETTRSFDCQFPQDVQVYQMNGHMHDFGKHMEVYLGPPGAAPTKIYEVEEWRVEYRDTPVTTEWPVEDPFIIPQGDVLTTSCTWNNTSDEVLTFPAEMCATFGYYYPGEETLICTNSSY